MSDDTAWLDATAQAELVRTKEVSPSELVGAAIARMEKLNPELNAVIHELFERARGEASSGALPDGPFRGVPFLLKDLGAELAGTPFNEGLAFSGDYRSTDDADAHPALHRRRLRHLRQDEHARARHPADDRAAPLRRLAQPVEHRPLDRRVLGRLGGGGRVGHGAGRARQRRRRLHPDSRLVLRPRRAEADAGAQLGGARLRRHDGRPGGRARGDAFGARLGGHPRRHGRSGPRRSLLGAAVARPLLRGRGRDAAGPACAWRS